MNRNLSYSVCRTVAMGLAGTAIWVLAAASAQAQSANEDGKIEEIVVTATKRAERINDLGMAINAFSGQQLQQLGLSSSTQIAQQTIGFSFAEGPLSHLPLSNIRGVSQNDFTGNLETPNAVYIDQAYVSFQGATAFQMFDLERVEIAKGPQGTLFGRNATGGLIQYLTKAPSDHLDGYVQVKGGELGTFEAQGAVGGPLGEGISGRLSATYHYNKPYQKNSAGPNLMRFEDYGIRGQLQIAPNESFTDRLILSYGRQDHTHAFQNSATGFDPVSGLEFVLPANQNPYGTCNGCDPSGFRDSDGSPFKSSQDIPGLYKSKTYSATNILTWNPSADTTFTGVTNYIKYKFSYQEDSDLSPRFGLHGSRVGNYNQFSQELRLNGNSGDLRWVAGVYYLSRNAKDTADQKFGLSWTDDMFANLGWIAPGDLSSLGTTDALVSAFKMNTRSYAAFGQTEYKFAPEWTLITGLRYSYDRIKYNFVSQEFIDGVASPTVLGGNIVFTPATAGNLTHNYKGELSGQIALNYRPRTGLLTYVSVNRSNKAGAWNAPFTGGAITPLKQEILTSLEGGFKASLADGRVQLNASVYHYFYHDYQGFIFLNFATQLTNLPAHVTGGEAELNVAPGGGWRMRVAAGYIDSWADTNVPAPGGATRDSKLPLAPRWTLNGMLMKSWPLMGGKFTVSADGVYTSSQYSEVLNSQASMIPSKILGNARVSWATDDGHIELAAMVRNIGDDRKPVFRIPTHLGFTQDMYDKPTSVFFEATYRF